MRQIPFCSPDLPLLFWICKGMEGVKKTPKNCGLSLRSEGPSWVMHQWIFRISRGTKVRGEVLEDLGPSCGLASFSWLPMWPWWGWSGPLSQYAPRIKGLANLGDVRMKGFRDHLVTFPHLQTENERTTELMLTTIATKIFKHLICSRHYSKDFTSTILLS